jgi:probable HAF family extracellular repeat protein
MAAKSWHYTTLNDPSAALGTATLGINDAGQIVGEYFTALDGNRFGNGFLFSHGAYTTINDLLTAVLPSFPGTVAYVINYKGQVVGSYSDGSGNHGFIYSDGVYTALNAPLGVRGTEAFGINNKGQIVGAYTHSSGIDHGFLFSRGTFITINGPLGAGIDDLFGINDKGQIVGEYGAGGTVHGFLYSNGVYTTIDDPLGFYSAAFGINNAGKIVGYYLDNNGAHGFLADAHETFGRLATRRSCLYCLVQRWCDTRSAAPGV